MHRLTRHIVRIAAIAGLAVASLAIATPAHAVNKGSSIDRGEYLNQGDYLTRSITGYSVQLIMQRDGNLVLKRTTVGYPVCWATGTAGRGHHAVYQQNGDFVVVNSAGRGIWRSNTIGETWETGQTVNIAADGDLYVGYKKMDSC